MVDCGLKGGAHQADAAAAHPPNTRDQMEGAGKRQLMQGERSEDGRRREGFGIGPTAPSRSALGAPPQGTKVDGRGEDVACWSINEGNGWRPIAAWGLPGLGTAHTNWSRDWAWNMVPLAYGGSRLFLWNC